jgi:hypothetical protein
MMPGADTEPGKPVSTNDMEAFNKMLMERRMHQVQHPLPSACGAPLPQYGNPSVVPSYSNAIQPKPVFFKDGLGNEYKTVGDRLYVLGWQDANIKIRLINEANGKEVATNGKKFQIYGWHLVQKMDESEATVSDDVSKIENEIGNDEDVNKDDLPKTEASNTLHPLSIPVIASDINNVASASTETKESGVAQDNILAEETKVDDRIDDKSTQSVEKAKETTVSETVASEDASESSNIMPKRRKPGKRRLI